ncbi:MAG TPA: hypothetical protein PLQ80_10465, partial [Candidatus Syntrophosphaera sp.]|nr:hypothetical protein [Candidatus Syntrophosphaera sp.]
GIFTFTILENMHTCFLSITFLRLSAEPVQVFCMGQLDPGLSGASNHFRREFFFALPKKPPPTSRKALKNRPLRWRKPKTSGLFSL